MRETIYKRKNEREQMSIEALYQTVKTKNISLEGKEERKGYRDIQIELGLILAQMTIERGKK